MELLLRAEGMTKCFEIGNDIVKVLTSIELNVNKGEYITIMGSSGSGKTTLLNCIATLDSLTSGKIYLNGLDISDLSDDDLAKFRRQQLGFIFQDSRLLSTLTIEENIALPMTINGHSSDCI